MLSNILCHLFFFAAVAVFKWHHTVMCKFRHAAKIMYLACDVIFAYAFIKSAKYLLSSPSFDKCPRPINQSMLLSGAAM